ncbi:MAG: hypothetical protein K8823_1106 [Cenarchaeum symbiont of Oopsacas minuta]|nr:hypothetical protein [Cenarchaeum symbiont of Oopsacas minuta]
MKYRIVFKYMMNIIHMEKDDVIHSLLESKELDSENRSMSDEFVDEHIITSRDFAGKKEMKIKIIEVSDETPPSAWKLGNRVKIDKILVTIKHTDTQKIEEAEFDIKSIEKEIAEKRHYSSTNRWVPMSDIKNGYIVNTRHTTLISDAVALDYITF